MWVVITKMSTKNSADVILKGAIPQEKDDFPDPNKLPLPSSHEPRQSEVTLSELIPGKYVTTTARVVFQEL